MCLPIILTRFHTRSSRDITTRTRGSKDRARTNIPTRGVIPRSKRTSSSSRTRGCSSPPQPYWYSAPYGEGANGGGAQANAQDGGVAGRDRDVKTQRRKEANRESARRSKQRKKEESELLSTKAQELVRESTSLRAELEKVQKQANKLYDENLALRSQVTKAGGLAPSSSSPVVPVKLPPPIKLPASLFKDIMGTPQPVKKEEAPATNALGAGAKEGAKEEREKKRQKTAAAKTLAASAPANGRSLEQGGIDLPGLLENELNAGEANAEQFVQLSAPAYEGNGNSGGRSAHERGNRVFPRAGERRSFPQQHVSRRAGDDERSSRGLTIPMGRTARPWTRPRNSTSFAALNSGKEDKRTRGASQEHSHLHTARARANRSCAPVREQTFCIFRIYNPNEKVT